MTMDFSRLTRKLLEYDLCNFNIKNWSGHVYRIANILNCEKNIVQGENFNLQPYQVISFMMKYIMNGPKIFQQNQS